MYCHQKLSLTLSPEHQFSQPKSFTDQFGPIIDNTVKDRTITVRMTRSKTTLWIYSRTLIENKGIKSSLKCFIVRS